MYQYRVSDSTISNFVPVVSVKSKVFIHEFIRFPSTENYWLKIATEFEELWHFTDCIGALDGKHITLFHALSRGPNYYDYEYFHNIVLMALVDANQIFLFVDIGCQGCLLDGAIYQNCSFF